MTSLIHTAQRVSRFKKDAYLKRLSEDDFRDTVVRPLFHRLGFGDGRDLCGPTEYGKDAIFSEVDNLRYTNIIAVQTKKGNLNLSRNTSQNVIEAITQLKTSLHTSIPEIRTKRRVFPTKVILCASGKINDAAKRQILEQTSDPRISFLDADEIVQLVDEHYPELWLNIDTDIHPYFSAIRKKIEEHGGNANVDWRENFLLRSATDDVFVPLEIFKTTITRKKTMGQFYSVPRFQKLPVTKVISRRARRIVIQGDAGTGKSTALLRMAYEICQKGISADQSYNVPVFLRAASLAASKEQSLVDICSTETRELAKTENPCFSTSDLDTGRVTVLIDGLDEVPDPTDKQAIVDLVQEFHTQFPNCQIIISSRPHSFLEREKGLSFFETWTISPIRYKQAEKIVRAISRQGKKQLSVAEAREVLRRLEQVHGVELNPLLVTVFAATSEHTRHDIPANITELFKKFVELMLGRWEEDKGLKQQYQAPMKDFLLRKIAFAMHRDKSTRISRSRFEHLIVNELASLGYSADRDQVLEEILGRSGLFRIVNDDELEFRHHILQEFFAGRGIESSDAIAEVISDEWWKLAIVFYFGENPNSASKLEDIVSGLPAALDRKVLTTAITIGLSAQACYLSEARRKIEIWKWVAGTFAELDLRRNESEEMFFPLIMFLTFCMVSKDALALSNIKDSYDNLRLWMGEQHSSARIFWLVMGLIEIGAYDLARNVLEEELPDEPEFILALDVQCQTVGNMRALISSERDDIVGIRDLMASRLVSVRNILKNEIELQLLEEKAKKVDG